MQRKYFIPFYCIAIIHLLSEYFSWNINLWSKPLLMPSLAIGLFWALSPSQRSVSFITTALAALAFSTAGDVLLQLEKLLHQPLYFYYGLGAFLVAQLMYILTFIRVGPRSISSSWMIVYLLYFLLFLYLLYPGMELRLKIPVTLYGLTLTWMAWNSWRCVRDMPQGLIAVIGALLFVASDSLLAINKFSSPIPNAGIWIMLTYILAQYFIVEGVRSNVQ